MKKLLKIVMMINMWVVFWYSFSYFSISTAGRVEIESSSSSHKYGIGLLMDKAPVPPSSASSCTHIGVGGNQGDRRPCPPSSGTTAGNLEAGNNIEIFPHPPCTHHQPCP